MKKKIKISTILFVLAGIFVIVGLIVFAHERGYINFGTESVNSTETPIPSVSSASVEKEDVNTNVSVSSADTKEEAVSEVSTEPDTEVEPEPEPEPVVLVENPYKEFFLQNSDMIAWLKIPDTIVDLPVMWTPEDEEYYLLRGFNKKKSGNGCLILDTDSSMDPLSTNLIIHGHNNPNAMFGNLDKYEDEDYMKAHPYIYLYGKDYEHIYQVMAVFRSKVFYKSDTCFKYYYFFNAENEEEFNYFYDNVKEMSYYDTGVTASFGDKFITLSTCSYHTENGRFVIVAREIEPGDYYEPFEDINKENNIEE